MEGAAGGVSGGRCACGRTLRVMELMGRCDDLIRLGGKYVRTFLSLSPSHPLSISPPVPLSLIVHPTLPHSPSPFIRTSLFVFLPSFLSLRPSLYLPRLHCSCFSCCLKIISTRIQLQIMLMIFRVISIEFKPYLSPCSLTLFLPHDHMNRVTLLSHESLSLSFA